MKKLTLFLFLLTASSSCTESAADVEIWTAKDVQVAVMARTRSCTLYRLRDGNYKYIYWTVCGSSGATSLAIP